MKKLFLVFFIALAFNSFAQDVPDSLLKTGWNMSGVVGLNLSQTAFSNWAQGGSNSLAYAAYTNLGGTYFNFPWKWKNRLNVIYGRTKLADVGYRTTENDIYFESVASRNIGWVVDPFVSVTVRTAVTKGYDYSVADTSIQIVDFFDPGYVSEAIGFTYDQNKIITTRLGLAFQQTFANRFTNYTDDPETPEIETFKFDTGIESVTEVKYNFLDNMTYSSFLRLFSRFTSLDVWDVRWDNIISAKVNDYINVNFSVTVLHEISQTKKTQLREALQIGFSYSLF
ncbi:MAG: DUF3078 domain-containing protein [Ignavibacteriaceae bacterium]|nr:DUF3078 domain-containing protein [Ignavibacterium sp.]MCC6253455.1 DUF3078 domain-containing protein [Ignavibacteriaceae bacterium]HMN24602.1 DUF3078 domain-containing protein [Ignavibacteriaceae bacterium]HRN27727.1 DUF3078 domain-containing protein [Ignavibacteriaceae bacterium]HRP93330.1 DUF3078 domain-containing protein [Ignavibacteriaceae bacterium]